MRKLITVAAVAATLAGPLAWSGEAAAHPSRHRHSHDNTGAVVTAGVLGLALGAAIASDNGGRRYHRDDRYYGRPYGRAYGYYGRPRCHVVTRWDPYWHRYVRYERCR